MPKNCACGSPNNINHALICKKGGFVSLRHNQIRDMEANLMREVCYDVKTEPPLLELSGETFAKKSTNTAGEARLDISARSVWNNMDITFFDVRIFHHGAASNHQQVIEETFKKHEEEKRRTYQQRIIQVEKATFTPLVFSTFGGMGPAAESLNQRLAALIAKKRDILYSEAISYIRKKLRFCILKTILVPIRGFRGYAAKEEDNESDWNLIDKLNLYF